ncbi:MAG TPA: hypothetical protein VGF47_10335 [Solirubrobacteraceae bacterium]
MKRIYLATLASLTLLLAVPGLATATLTEVGVIPPTTPETTPSCPASPCLAVSRTTGFQVKVATNTTLTNIPKAGSIVAWTINLGKPNATQIKFFNANEGGAAEAGIAILAPQKKPNLTYKLIASGPMVKLEKYFGKTVQFPLERSIQVKKGYIVALTVPTWAPALALGFGKDTSWRASREKKQCASTSSQSTQTSIGSEVQYFCLYQTARLTYSATLVSTP